MLISANPIHAPGDECEGKGKHDGFDGCALATRQKQPDEHGPEEQLEHDEQRHGNGHSAAVAKTPHRGKAEEKQWRDRSDRESRQHRGRKERGRVQPPISNAEEPQSTHDRCERNNKENAGRDVVGQQRERCEQQGRGRRVDESLRDRVTERRVPVKVMLAGDPEDVEVDGRPRHPVPVPDVARDEDEQQERRDDQERLRARGPRALRAGRDIGRGDRMRLRAHCFCLYGNRGQRRAVGCASLDPAERSGSH